MIQVIQRAGAILRSLEAHPGGRSVSEVATDVGLPRSSVHRILKSLEEEHLVSTESAERGFRLGPALMHLASSASAWLTEHAHALIQELSADMDETVDLAIRSGATVYFIDQVVATNRLQALSATGLHFPLHCTANGKALLSELDDKGMISLVGSELERLTANTIVDVDELISEVNEVRRTGVAFDREEHHEGISAIGTPLRNPYGLPAALSVPVPTSRFELRVDALGEQLLAGRARIESALKAS